MFNRAFNYPLWPMAAGLVLALAIGGFSGSMLSQQQLIAATSDTPASKALSTTTFAPVVKKAMPSVVNVFSSRNMPAAINRTFEFYSRERQERGLGSGVIISSDGYIVTNHHVVEGANEVKVALGDKREFPARVVGTDSKTDLAVLKIEQTGLPALPLSDSSKVQVGDVVLAIGNPFGVGQTVTMGIVSATGRGGLGIEDYEDFIQTDAAINPGNSGGALVNAEGQLIGINTAILSRSGGSQGIGFAIPASMARNVTDQIMRGGKVSRAQLGVLIQPMTPGLAKAFKLTKAEGALVSDVLPNTPAERAGLRPGDVVTRVEDRSVSDSRTLQLMIAEMNPGKSVLVTVMRDGNERQFTVALGEQTPDQKTKRSPMSSAYRREP